MRAAKLLVLGGAFIGTSLIGLIGCGGESSPQTTPDNERPIPAVLTAPVKTAALADGGKMVLRLVPSSSGVVWGDAVIFPPKGTEGERPVLLSVSGTTTNMDLVARNEKNDDIDYRLVGNVSNGVFNANLLAGPDASPGDEPPQALGFAERGRAKVTPQASSGRAGEYITANLDLFNGLTAYRYRLYPGIFVRDEFGSAQVFDIGFRICVNCDDKFTDYSNVYATLFEPDDEYLLVNIYDAAGEVGWNTFDRENGTFSIKPDGEYIFFVYRSDHNDETEFGRLTNISGPLRLIR